MRPLFQRNTTLVRQAFAAGFFHFIHAFTTILLLLLVGQIISQSDSTKSRLLQFLLLGKFQPQYQWHWVFALLAIKFVGTALRNYYMQLVPFKIQVLLQDYWIEYGRQAAGFSPDKDIKKYARAYIKGRILWLADICLLLLIFILLFYLNIRVALFWLILWIMGMLFRWWVVHFYLNARKSWKEANLLLLKKWKFIFSNSYRLKTDQQWKKELRILKRREDKAVDTFRYFGFQKAWTSGFFPVYFFSFVFGMIWFFKASGVNQTVILQIILLIIYSQGALMRSFKAPEYWKIIRLAQKKWDESISGLNNQTLSEEQEATLLFAETKLHDVDAITNQEWNQIITLFNINQNIHEKYYKTIFKKFCLVDLEKPLIGDTFLSAVISDKERIQIGRAHV